jgi:hypothetical protein
MLEVSRRPRVAEVAATPATRISNREFSLSGADVKCCQLVLTPIVWSSSEVHAYDRFFRFLVRPALPLPGLR